MADVGKKKEAIERWSGRNSKQGGEGATARERIFNACDFVAREQKRVTEATILGIVGGSASTVHRYVSEWKGLAVLRDQAPSVPSTFLEGIQKLFDQLVNDAAAAGRAREDELEEELEALKEVVGKLNTEAAQRDTETRELKEANQSLTGKVTELEGQRDAMKTDLAAAESYRGTLEQQLADEEARAKQFELDARAQADQMRSAHAAELQRLSDVFERNEDRLYRDIGQLRDDLKAKDQGLEEKLSEQRSDLAKECERQVIELQRAHAAELDRLNGRVDELVGERKTQDRERREEMRSVVAAHGKELSKLTRIVDGIAAVSGISAERLLDDEGALRELNAMLNVSSKKINR